MKLIHIIVAYNSPNDIFKLCNQIGIQNEEMHHIICIDNSDIEFKRLNHKALTELGQEFIVNYFPTDINIGSAGGFAMGMQRAYNMNAEWIWLHDQDGYPMADCLQNLSNHFYENYLIAPQVVDENSKYLGVFNGIYDINDNIQFISLNNDVNYTDVAGTAGLMINRKLIDLIGVYDYIHYFIGQEDFDYCMRAKKAGVKTVVIRDALYFHPNKWPAATRNRNTRNYNIGQVENEREKNGAVYYKVLYSSKFLIISIFYSTIYLFGKKIFGKKVYARQTLYTYIKALKNRTLKVNKISYH